MAADPKATDAYEHNTAQPHTHTPIAIPQWANKANTGIEPPPPAKVRCACGDNGVATLVPGHLLVEWSN